MANEDLELKDLNGFSGTENYHKVMQTNVTDGVKYVIDNGYSWFVTDAIAAVVGKHLLENEAFLKIELKLNEKQKTANMVIEDGDGKKLYKQHYKWTDAKTGFTLYWTGGVLMLKGEY